MAYIVKDIEEDKKENQQKQVPSVSGSSGSPYSGVGQAQPTGNPAPNKQGIGTGFTNLSNYLSAGRGRDKAITSESQRLIGNEKQSFGQAYQGAYRDLNKKPLELNGRVQGALDNSKPGLGGPTIEQVLNQDYSGPERINYTPGQGLGKAQALGDKSTISSVLVNEPKKQSAYTQGMRSLDQALYGADPASIAASRKSVKDVDLLNKQTSALTDQFGKDVSAKKEQIKDIKDRTVKGLNEYKSNLSGEIQSRADAVNARDSAVFNNLVQREGYTPEWVGSAAGSANINNQMTSDEERKFGLLSKYLGGEAQTRQDDYVKGNYRYNKNPEEPKESPVSDEYKYELFHNINKLIKEQSAGSLFMAGMTGHEISSLLNDYNPDQIKYLLDGYLDQLGHSLDINGDQKQMAIKFINQLKEAYKLN